MSDEPDGVGRPQHQIRLVSYGTAVSGALILLVDFASSQPYGILFFGLGGLALATLVFERTQGAAVGLSLGLLTGSVAVWLWPIVDGGAYSALGVLLLAVSVLNVVVLPSFYRLGERLAER